MLTTWAAVAIRRRWPSYTQPVPVVTCSFSRWPRIANVDGAMFSTTPGMRASAPPPLSVTRSVACSASAATPTASAAQASRRVLRRCASMPRASDAGSASDDAERRCNRGTRRPLSVLGGAHGDRDADLAVGRLEDVRPVRRRVQPGVDEAARAGQLAHAPGQVLAHGPAPAAAHVAGRADARGRVAPL